MKIAKSNTGHYHRQIPAPSWTAGMILIAGLCVAGQLASAQSVHIRARPLRVTVADSGTTVNTLTNYVNIGGTPGTETLSVLGLPAGDTYAYSSFYGFSGTTNFGTWLTNTAVNVPDGVYTMDINASGGVVGDLLLTLQSGRMWTGATNVTTDWSSSSSWVGGVPPGPNSDVLFTGLGAQTNDYINGVFTPNSIVDQPFTIASLRFSQTNGSIYHTILIDPGVTLSLTGTNGLSLLQDDVLTGSGMICTIAGVGGTLDVDNTNANVTLLEDNQTQHTLDLSQLGTFIANINRFAPGDYTLYPEATNLLAQGYGTGSPFTMPNKFYTHTYLALTNFITAHYVDPNNYTNSETNRLYALEVVNNPFSASSSGAAQNFSLGITNVFNLDGVCVSGFGGTTVAFNFNPALHITTNIVVGVSTNYVTNSMVAIFRNTDGVSPMDVFTVGDLANTQTNSQGNTKGNVDFGSSGGYVDMLVDRFYMSRDRTNCINSSGDDAQTTFGMGAGIVNANTMIIGDQESGDQPVQGFVYGTLTVSNSGVIVANKSIQLGYSTADYNDLSLPGVSYGYLNINAGGTVMANTIGVGGPTGNSGEVGYMGGSSGSAKLNTISMNGGTLIVSNYVGSDSAFGTNGFQSETSGIVPGMLGQLNMVNSSLELFINGSTNGPYVNTCQLTYSGSTSNTLIIGSIKNLTVPSVGSTNIPLIWVQDASPNASAVSAAFTQIIVPSGYQGALVLDATNSQILDLNLSTHTPNNLKWQGYANNNWDTTSTNWLDMNTGLHTNFQNGDFTTFDDSSTVTNINITSAVQLIPNNVTVANNTSYYQFSGSSLIGGATITKSGTGVLEVDSMMTLGTLLNKGMLVGNGTIGNVTVAAGATLKYNGTINGNVSCGGLGLNNGTINGQLTVSTGGVFTNFTTLNGYFNVQSNAFLYNKAGGQINYGLGLTATIATNASFINGGSVNGDVISDAGTFDDLDSSLTLNSLSVVAGGVFYPGADSVGETTINPSGLGGYNFPGAMVLAQGSTTVLNVVNSSTYTTVYPDFMSFGASSSAQTQNGATLQINNLGPAFTAGERFNFFVGPPSNTGSSTNTFPIISPSRPGPGLVWDLSQLWSNGSIGVIAPPVFTLTNNISVQGTNVVLQLSWDQAYAGYRLETQVDPVSTGLRPASTNWSGVSGSWTNLTENITNTIGTNCVFYRLVFP